MQYTRSILQLFSLSPNPPLTKNSLIIRIIIKYIESHPPPLTRIPNPLRHMRRRCFLELVEQVVWEGVYFEVLDHAGGVDAFGEYDGLGKQRVSE